MKRGWHGPRAGEPFPTLGYRVGEWMENYCVVPNGPRQGEPFILTNEMLRFLLFYFRLRPETTNISWRPLEHAPSAAFVFRGGQLMRPQKWGKSPFGGALCLAHAFGPVVFDGWDSNGDAVGTTQPTPWVQIVSTSEEQTDNTWLATYEMAARGPLAAGGLDIGLTDINLPDGGKIEPRTSAGHSRLGARITFAVFDETHLMTQSNGGLLLATTMKRNLSGMGGRWLETTNAYDPSENSVAQRTHEAVAREQVSDVMIDYRPPPRRPDLNDLDDSLELLRYCYGDSYWVSVERIYADARDPSVCPTQTDAMRYFFNLPEVGIDEAIDPVRWDQLARPAEFLQPKTKIALGFKGGAGSLSDADSARAACTSIVASRLSDGRWFHIATWPANYADESGFSQLRREVHETIVACFAAYDVCYLVGDPSNWRQELDTWSGRYPKRVVEISTSVDSRIDQVIQRFTAAFAGNFTHDGNETLAAHAKSAAWAKGGKRKPRPEESTLISHHYIRIVKKWDSHPIDAFVAGMLAETGRGLAVEHGADKPPRKPLFAFT